MNKPTYQTSTGQRVTQSQIESRMRVAKENVIQAQLDEHGYNFCVECGKNGNGTRLDMSHNISIKSAKEQGKTELCWDEENIKVRCRSCHEKLDKLILQFNNRS